MIAMTLENVTYAVFGPKSVKTLNELIKFQKMAERVGVFQISAAIFKISNIFTLTVVGSAR